MKISPMRKRQAGYFEVKISLYLTNLALPTAFPVFKPAPKMSPYYGPSPPDEQCQLDGQVDLYDTIDPLPAED